MCIGLYIRYNTDSLSVLTRNLCISRHQTLLLLVFLYRKSTKVVVIILVNVHSVNERKYM